MLSQQYESLFYFLLLKSEPPRESLLKAKAEEDEPLLDNGTSFNSMEESEEMFEREFLKEIIESLFFS